MATGIKLEFTDKGISFNFNETVSGFDAVAQNALVNLAQTKGSDKAFPTKGTDLFKAGLRGAMVNTNTAAHTSNFAASDTLFFSRTWENSGEPEALHRVALKPATRTVNRLKVDVLFISLTGKTIGKTSIL